MIILKCFTYPILNFRYRLAVLRALPKLEKLDDKVVTPEELQTALLKGRVLIHPLATMIQEAESSPQSAPESPEVCQK